MTPAQAFKLLGLARDADAAAIRKAYADSLRAIDPDADVAGFTRLRAARDAALADARRRSENGKTEEHDPFAGVSHEVGQNEPAVATETARPALRLPWIHVAPTLDRSEKPGDLTIPAVTWPQELRFGMPWLEQATSGSVREVPSMPGWAFGVPLAAASNVDPAHCVVVGRRNDVLLHALLYPAEGEEGAAMSAAEQSQAEACLTALLAEARDGTLATHDAIETWLGRTLAGAWPRSAPLVEPAAQAFGWERVAGRLGERPEIAFLNARRAGMQFHFEVLKPGHPYNKAWQELQRPGAPGMFSRWHASQGDVHNLIAEVRTRFPELEHFWDPQRVAARERVSSQPTEARGPGYWVWIVVGLMIFRLLAGFADSSPSQGQPSYLADRARADQTVTEAFGAGRTLSWLREKQPDLARFLEVEIARMGTDADPAAIEQDFIEEVRIRTEAAGRALGGSDLDRAMYLRLRLARSIPSADACMDFLKSGHPRIPLNLSEGLRQDERAYAAALTEKGLMAPSVERDTKTAGIPESVYATAKAKSRLSEAEFKLALAHNGSNRAQCETWIALLDAALAYQGKGRAELLAVL